MGARQVRDGIAVSFEMFHRLPPWRTPTMKTLNRDLARQAVAISELDAHLRTALADLVGSRGVRAAGWDSEEDAPTFLVDASGDRGSAILARLRETYNVAARLPSGGGWREGLLLIAPIHLRRRPESSSPHVFRVDVELD